MSYIFTVKTKSGKIVHLSHERWTHIVQKHQDLSGSLEKIRETIIEPSFIKENRYEKEIRDYYKYYKEDKRYLLVAVKYLNDEGFTTTSFFTKKVQ